MPDKDKNVLGLNQLAVKMENEPSIRPFTSAQFALQMVEGLQKVRFAMGSDHIVESVVLLSNVSNSKS